MSRWEVAADKPIARLARIAKTSLAAAAAGIPAQLRNAWATPLWRSSDLAGAIARAGVDVTLPERQLKDAIRDAIGERRSYIDGLDFSIKGWCVTLLYPEREEFSGTHLSIARGWCLVWMMGTNGELGITEFAI